MNSSHGSIVPFTASISDLTTELLEREPSRYWEVLEYLSKDQGLEHKEALREKLNETPYETWHSNHVFSLSRLVGPINQGVIDEGYDIDTWYGSRNRDGIGQELAISLLKMMVNCGCDILAKDYYEKDIVDSLTHPENSKFHRTNNDKFVMVVKSIYNKHMSPEEGVPP
jgi:hypothetical protein